MIEQVPGRVVRVRLRERYPWPSRWFAWDVRIGSQVRRVFVNRWYTVCGFWAGGPRVHSLLIPHGVWRVPWGEIAEVRP